MSSNTSFWWTCLGLTVGAVATVLYARVLGSEDESDVRRRLQQVGTVENVIQNLCTDCRQKANVPACSYICNLNAINVTHPELGKLTGLYFSRPDTVADRSVRWVIGLECHTDGKIEGFSTALIGSRYQEYDINGLYIGDETLLLLLRTAFASSAPANEPPTISISPTEANPLDLATDPEAVGLRVRIVNFDLLHARTTGYTYVDPRGPFELIFERRTKDDLVSYFELTS